MLNMEGIPKLRPPQYKPVINIIPNTREVMEIPA
jgi:hypothetical protein